MRGISAAIMGAIMQLYSSKEADRAVKESETMADMVAKLLPIAVGILIAGAINKPGREGVKWPAKKGA